MIMKKDSILESNMVQTVGSAGESLAAGAIFTMPALFIWAREGVMDKLWLYKKNDMRSLLNHSLKQVIVRRISIGGI